MLSRLEAGGQAAVRYRPLYQLHCGRRKKIIINRLPFNPLRNPDQRRQLEEEDAGMQFSHSLEEQIGGQLEAGFRLIALYEDTNGEGRLHEMNIPTFLAMLSVKP